MNVIRLTLATALLHGLALPGSRAAEESTLKSDFARQELRQFLAPAAARNAAGDEALARLRIVAEAWRAAPEPDDDPTFSGNAHARRNPRATLRRDFFSWKHLFGAADRLAAAGQLDDALRSALRAMARDAVRPMERGPNNRSFHFALGAAHAARLFPDEPEAARWRAYAEAVWQDWWTLGDCYEPGYVPHHLPQIIELGLLLGHEEQLRSPQARAVWARFRDHVSASGHSVQPGDGHDGSGYAEGLALAARVTGDGSLLAAAEAALARVPDDFAGRAELAALVAAVRRELPDASTAHAPVTQVQHLYPATVRHPERVLLSAPAAPMRPYAAFYLDDAAETLFHAHEDNRGALFHHEAGGVLLLGKPNWLKWVGQSSTFVVAHTDEQFPHPVSRGPAAGIWRDYSANIRPLRYFGEGDGWTRGADSPREQYMRALLAPGGLGYAWANPEGLAGRRDRLAARSVTLRFLALPQAEARAASQANDHFLYSASFEAGMFWYREYRNVAGLDGPLVADVSRLALNGPTGAKLLHALDLIPDGAELVHHAAGAKGAPGRVVPRAEWGSFLQVVPGAAPGGGLALRVTCPPGRLDLTLPVDAGEFDLTREYPRLDLAVRVVAPDTNLLRLPVGVLVNGLRARSTYLDLQQGGVLAAATGDTRGDDSHTAMDYRGVFTADSNWKRRAVLTREGALVVLDEFTAGASAVGRAGGPVWQLPHAPRAGLNWFSSRSVERADRSVLVWFHPEAGAEHGVQFQPKFAADSDHAVFARRALAPGRTERFLSVLLPHATDDDPGAWSGMRPTHGRPVDPERAAVRSEVRADGFARAQFRLDGSLVTVELRPDGAWSVTRKAAP